MSKQLPQKPASYEDAYARCRVTIDTAYLRLLEATHRELERRVKLITPANFEELVVQLLLRITKGFRSEVTGRSGDGGIDGVIYLDPLGSEEILVQAKRWPKNPVGRPEVQKFFGAVVGRQAKKGVLVTTSRFTKQARSFCDGTAPKIILIDGMKLAELLYDNDIGVAKDVAYEIKYLGSKPVAWPSGGGLTIT